MSSVVQLTDAPPCPSCGREALELAKVDHSVDLYIDPLTRFNVAANQWSYEIRPCGHEIAAFDCTEERILRWHP